MDPRTRLTITPDLLARAGDSSGLAQVHVTKLWDELDKLAPRSRFNVANVAFYFGALVIISAMTFYMTTSWDETSGAFKTAAALVYAAVFAGGSYVLGRSGASVPAGLLATAAVCMTPLAVYGLETSAHIFSAGSLGAFDDLFDDAKGRLLMELATVVAGLVTIFYVRFPFLVAPIAFAGWFASMDFAPFLFHDTAWTLEWHQRATVTALVGIAMIVSAVVIDRLTKEDYAFWLYFFGSLSFWAGLWLHGDEAAAYHFLTLPIGLAFIAASLVLGRRVLAVFGGLGCFGYLGSLAWQFQDSLSFPVSLTLGGLCVIGLGYVYQRNVARIEVAVNTAIPPSVKRLIPRSRVL